MQPLTGWTGQTRCVRWAGRKYRPVRVNLKALILSVYLCVGKFLWDVTETYVTFMLSPFIPSVSLSDASF